MEIAIGEVTKYSNRSRARVVDMACEAALSFERNGGILVESKRPKYFLIDSQSTSNRILQISTQ